MLKKLPVSMHVNDMQHFNYVFGLYVCVCVCVCVWLCVCACVCVHTEQSVSVRCMWIMCEHVLRFSGHSVNEAMFEASEYWFPMRPIRLHHLVKLQFCIQLVMYCICIDCLHK